MKRTDWIIADDFDEELDENGDYIEGESNRQEAVEALDCVKGEVAQYPTAGVGMVNYMRKVSDGGVRLNNRKKFIRDSKVELERDLQENPEIIVNEDLSEFEIKVEE